MKRPQDMHDLFTLSPVAESKAAEGHGTESRLTLI
jgi:hypothetical protein